MSEWTIAEKTKLLNALKKHGLSSIDLIAESVPLKSIGEINVMIERYKRLANYKPEEKYEMNTPIDQWTEVLRKYTSFSELQPVAKALKYIALFEERKEDKISLRDCYQMLSDISHGVAPKQLDGATSAFFFDTMVHLAKNLRRADNKEAQQFLRNIKIHNNSAIKTYTKKRQNEDSSVNPLKLPEELYKRRREK